jgi:MFS family permease
MTASQQQTSASGFAPLRQKVFAVLWGGDDHRQYRQFMRDVASAWLVTDLSGAPAAVALVQRPRRCRSSCSRSPPAVLSDILDRRRFLIAIQLLLGLVSLALMALAGSGQLSVSSLVGLTFLGGVGAALMAPTWQAIVPELVNKADLKSAVALNSLGINISRAIGPALGGLLLATFGAAVTYGADVLSYVVVIIALFWWRRAAGADDVLSERFAGAFPRRPALRQGEPRTACRAYPRGDLLRLRQRRLGVAAAGRPRSAWRWGRVSTASCWAPSAQARSAAPSCCRACATASMPMACCSFPAR